MTNAELIGKLVQLDPSAPATISVKDAAGVTTSMPVLWIAKNAMYGKLPAFSASPAVVEKVFGPEAAEIPVQAWDNLPIAHKSLGLKPF